MVASRTFLFGMPLTMEDVATIVGMAGGVIRSRIAKGWSLLDAVSLPPPHARGVKPPTPKTPSTCDRSTATTVMQGEAP
jgi:hypothetical protein